MAQGSGLTYRYFTKHSGDDAFDRDEEGHLVETDLVALPLSKPVEDKEKGGWFGQGPGE